MDTLAVRLTLPTTKRVVDFHHQAIAHGGRTTQPRRVNTLVAADFYSPVSTAVLAVARFLRVV